VIANDADGAPWIFDSDDHSVRCFYWKAGTWCDPKFESHDEFMHHLMYNDQNSEDWIKAIQIIRNHGG